MEVERGAYGLGAGEDAQLVEDVRLVDLWEGGAGQVGGFGSQQAVGGRALASVPPAGAASKGLQLAGTGTHIAIGLP
jgi:hypothetical protein